MAIKAIAIGLTVLYLLSGFTTVYIGPDVVVYTLIGDAIFRDGALPYAYVFDHKPVVTYYAYGLAHLVYPFRYGLFCFIAVVGAAITAVVTCRAFGLQRHQFWFFVLYALLGANYDFYIGNTESIANALIAPSIAFLMTSREGRPVARALVAGLFAAFAINVNYLAGIVLSVPTLMLIFSSGSRLLRMVAYGAGVAIGLLLVFAPYLISGASILDYLSLQSMFGSAYSPSLKERGYSTLKWAYLGVYFIPLVIAYWAMKDAPPAEQSDAGTGGESLHEAGVGVQGYKTVGNKTDANRPVVYAWAASAIAATLVSGWAWGHYFLFVLPPLVIMALTLIFRRRIARELFLVVATPILVYSAIGCAYWIHSAYATGRAIDGFDSKAISSIVGDKPVLNIGSSHVLLYLARLRAAQPFVFPDHAQIVFGDKQAAHYLSSLDGKPEFVLTGYHFCPEDSALHTVCERIARDYVVVSEKDDQDDPAFAYSLYRLKH